MAARGDLGPGMCAALSALGRSGQTILARWTDPPGGETASNEWTEGAFLDGGRQGNRRGDETIQFDESRPGTRWRVYHRCGIACALLRRVASTRRNRRPH
ncbi:MAG: hypothetical protein JXL80_14935 [Planctomycetes bacterium]|nr:hypothetical protein [Planctomycetota bacterium]